MADLTTSGLAARISGLVNLWRTRELQMVAWLSGTVGGGPNSDGKYPLSDYLGNVTLVTCPAALEDSVASPAATASAAATSASSSAAAAAASETSAATSATSAASSATKATSAATVATSMASNVGTSVSSVTTSKNTAVAAAASATTAATSAAASKTSAANSAASAAASASTASTANANTQSLWNTITTSQLNTTILLSDPIDGGNLADAPAYGVFDCGTYS